MNISIKKVLPHISAISLFLILSIAYFSPVLQGEKLSQHDMKSYAGMSKEIKDFKKESGEQTLWTNSMFGGMPTYLIKNYSPNNYIRYVEKIFLKYKIRPIGFLFMYFFGFYLMLLVFGLNVKQSVLGALAFGLSTYFLIIIQAGHLTKVITLGYMPPIIGGVYAAYRGKKYLGTILMGIFLSMQLINNHLQITYYTLLTLLPLIIILFVNSIKDKKIDEFIKSSLVLLVGLILVVGSNFQTLLTTYEYGKQSLRGPSELTIDADNQTSGLDKDYATSWSYGKLETFNMLIPNLMGGSSDGKLSKDSEVYKKLIQGGYSKKQALQAIEHMPTYWGPQPMTSGPVYIGALVIFLFVLGIFLVKGEIRTWLLIATALAIMLAWGRNFMFLTDLFFDYFPGYNKFRTVSMILIIAQLTIPLLGLLGLKNIIDKKSSKNEILKSLKYSTAIVGGMILVFIINPGLLSFTSEGDARLGEFLATSIVEDRESIMQADAFRSLIFVLIGAVAIWLFIQNKIKTSYLYIILGVAILIDLWAVDKRYLNDDNFVNKQKVIKPYTATQADTYILKDTLSYRVVNLAVSTFNDANTSYFHKSIGGYHGAKMRRYQELINHGISFELQQIMSTLQNKPTQITIDNVLKSIDVLNMLNTKYIIYNPNAAPLINSNALGNAWFINNVKVVADANEEIKAISNFNSATTVIVDKRFKDLLFDFEKDSTATIVLTDYKPNHLTYKSSTKSEQLAVLSEIYYDKGWNAYIDGEHVPHFRVNYVLRAMQVPAGDHVIEYKFEPKSWKIGGIISLISSILLILISIVVIYLEFNKKKVPIK